MGGRGAGVEDGSERGRAERRGRRGARDEGPLRGSRARATAVLIEATAAGAARSSRPQCSACRREGVGTCRSFCLTAVLRAVRSARMGLGRAPGPGPHSAGLRPEAPGLAPCGRPGGAPAQLQSLLRSSRGRLPFRCSCSPWLSCVRLRVAHQVPLSVGFSRQEYWRGLPCPPPGDLPDPGVQPASLTLLHRQAGSARAPGKPNRAGR